MKSSFPRNSPAVLLLMMLPAAEAAIPPNAPPTTSIAPTKTRNTGVADVFGKPVGQIVPDYFGLSTGRLVTNVAGIDVGMPISPVELRITVNGLIQSQYVWQTVPASTVRYAQANCVGTPIIEDRAYVELDGVRVAMLYQTPPNPPVLLIAQPGRAQQIQVQSQGDPMISLCSNASFTVMGRALDRAVPWPYKELYPVRLP